MDDEQKKRRYAKWAEIGEDAIRADMDTGGHRLVGGSPEVRRLAQQWLNERHQSRETRQDELQVKQGKHESRRFFWSSLLAILAIIVAVVLWIVSG